MNEESLPHKRENIFTSIMSAKNNTYFILFLPKFVIPLTPVTHLQIPPLRQINQVNKQNGSRISKYYVVYNQKTD